MITKSILNFQEFCEYTGFRPSYVYKLTASKKIPYSRPHGGKIFFDKEQVDKWLMSNPVATMEEIEASASTYLATK
jgi:prophage regulatory protein